MPTLSIFERRARIPLLYRDGYNANEMAALLGVHRHTLGGDLLTLGLGLYSDISDRELDNVIAAEFLESYVSIGNHALEARLLSQTPPLRI